MRDLDKQVTLLRQTLLEEFKTDEKAYDELLHRYIRLLFTTDLRAKTATKAEPKDRQNLS